MLRKRVLRAAHSGEQVRHRSFAVHQMDYCQQALVVPEGGQQPCSEEKPFLKSNALWRAFPQRGISLDFCKSLPDVRCHQSTSGAGDHQFGRQPEAGCHEQAEQDRKYQDPHATPPPLLLLL